ncbi:MAG: heat-inducible transcriptional repressor HrcA [bacterium]
MDSSLLLERNKKILEAVIQKFAATAKPVSSKTIAPYFRLSSATIRHIFSELEQAGYLGHPHTSAGRIPTDRGYRLYVDSLMEAKHLTPEEQELIKEKYRRISTQKRDMRQIIPFLLADLVHYPAITLTIWDKSSLRHIEFLKLDKRRLVILLVMSTGLTKDQVVLLKREIAHDFLKELTDDLNRELGGHNLREVLAWLEDRWPLDKEVEDILTHLLSMIEGILDEEISLEGVYMISREPEFFDGRRLGKLLKTLEERQILAEIINRHQNQEGPWVSIGQENLCPDIQNCSLVMATYRNKQETVGTLGIIGPTRMRYERVVPVVDFVSKMATTMLTEGEI